MDCWIITGHDVYGVGSWLEDALELHAAEVPLMEYAGGVQILIDGVNGSSSCGNRPFCVWFLLGSLAPSRRNCMPEIRVILKSGLLFPQSHPLPLFYSDEMWQNLLMEGVRSEPKYAELAYFRSILGNTGTQKRKALLLPSFVCQFPRDGDRQYIGEVKSRETISYPISDKISHTTLTKSQAKSQSPHLMGLRSAHHVWWWYHRSLW